MISQKEKINRINKQTHKINRSNEKVLNVKISKPSREEILRDHVMVDVNAQAKQDYIDLHGEMEFRHE